MPNIVVLGAGVSGLTTAMLLSRNGEHQVTVVAKHMPGDYDIEYASPWAGATFWPAADELDRKWEKETWPELARLADRSPEAGIHYQKSTVYTRIKDFGSTEDNLTTNLTSPSPWFKDLVPDFKLLPRENLVPGTDSAITFTSGCVLRRAIVSHVTQASNLHHTSEPTDLIINCTGLLASTLGGVMDKNVIPVRGQTVLVRNYPGGMFTISDTDDGRDEISYIMPRAGGGGTILGGIYEKGRWDSQPVPNLAMRIMKRAVDLCPALMHGKGVEALSIIRHGVGLRPLRLGGVRIERERIGSVWVVHNYGHGGWGYQASYGCANGVLKLVDEVLGHVTTDHL